MEISKARRASCQAAISVVLAFLALTWPGGIDASAQTGTLQVQAALIDDAATTYTLGIRYTAPRTEPALPRPGETSEEAVNEWLITAMAGGGVSRGRGDNTENVATLVGQLGMLYRIGSTIEQVGVVAYGNLNPGLVGPALTVRVAIVELLAGGVWMEGGASGLVWFLGAGVSWEFVRDVFER